MGRTEGERTCAWERGSLRALGLVVAMALVLAPVGCRGAADAREAQVASSIAPSSAPPATDAPEALAPDAPTPKSTSPATPAAIDTSAPAASSAIEPPTEERPAGPELPRGGRELFPEHRLVGFCGTPGAPALGRLLGNLPVKTKQLVSYAEKYARGRKILPAFELIAVVVQGAPGKDKKWRRRVPDSVVDDYLRAARAAKGILLLNIQPGHSDFLTEAKAFEKYLREPDVGVALDPEWAMRGKQKPGAVYGQTTGPAINEVAAYLSDLVKAGDLPEKALVFHQVNNHVLKDEAALVAHPGVVLVKSVDGLGPKATKIRTYNVLMKTKPAPVRGGFKLFFDEDTRNGHKLMTPDEVLALTPEPDYVMYE